MEGDTRDLVKAKLGRIPHPILNSVLISDLSYQDLDYKGSCTEQSANSPNLVLRKPDKVIALEVLPSLVIAIALVTSSCEDEVNPRKGFLCSSAGRQSFVWSLNLGEP